MKDEEKKNEEGGCLEKEKEKNTFFFFFFGAKGKETGVVKGEPKDLGHFGLLVK